MPISLRVLGQSELRDAAGASVEAVLAQPKRFALLAYLASETPLRLHRRDALLLLFWPEADESHARGNLSQALSFLRRHLGEAVIRTRGTEEVGVDPETIESDVVRFEQAMADGDAARALGRYAGDLLPAFHLDGCHEFDEWLLGARARLRELATRAAKAVHAEAERSGDHSKAILAARHALLLAPLDESAAARTMRALCDGKRPALALHEYEAFRMRLRAELGVEPSRELREMAERIRAASGVGSV